MKTQRDSAGIFSRWSGKYRRRYPAIAQGLLTLLSCSLVTITGRMQLQRDAYESVQLGDSVAAVVSKMGRPAEEEQVSGRSLAELRYVYRVWPARKSYVIGFRVGEVSERTMEQAPY